MDNEQQSQQPHFRVYHPGDETIETLQVDFRGDAAVPFIRDFINDRKLQPHVSRGTLENDLQTLQDTWVSWTTKTFGGSPIIAGRKLMRESQELLDAVESEQWDNVKKELADVFMIVLDIAGKCDVTVQDLINESTDKFNVNQSRNWVQQNDGTFQHVESLTDVEIKNGTFISIDLCKQLKAHGIAQCAAWCFVSSIELKFDKTVIAKHALEQIGYDNIDVICDVFTRGDICMMLHTDVNDDETTVHEICHNATWHPESLHEMNIALREKYEPHTITKIKKP